MKVEEMKRVAYISGPMEGIPEHNFPAFLEAEAELRKAGFRVRNPAKNFGGKTDLKRSTYMYVDIQAVLNADVVFVLPGWEQSRGARVEVLIAQELEILVRDYEVWKLSPGSPNLTESKVGVYTYVG